MRQRFISFFILIFLFVSAFNSHAYDGIEMQGTLVLEKSQFPESLKKYNLSHVYILFSDPIYKFEKFRKLCIRKDTVFNYKKFTDSFSLNIDGYRLIFESNNKIDSVWQTDPGFKITDKAFNLGNNKLRVFAFNAAGKLVDQFVFNYGLKFKSIGVPTIKDFLRYHHIYDSFDRNEYAVNTVWMLSIGIDDYGSIQWKSCKSDAVSYVEFFKKQYIETLGPGMEDISSLFHEYVLLDNQATKQAIIDVLKEIASKAAFNDYFIFNFSGQSNMFGKDSLTYFFPTEVVGYIYNPVNRNKKDSTPVLENLLSLKTIQEHVQFIKANNQLFISEAGPSEKFKTEFIKTMMQNSPAIASILNKNRIIIVPERAGMDNVVCDGTLISKGPINYYITSLDPKYNIYDLFEENKEAKAVAYSLKNKDYTCKGFNYEYFDVFFEKEFLKQYQEIIGVGGPKKRGVELEQTMVDDSINVPGKKYALIVGIDDYKGGWEKLFNPVYDAVEVADVLNNYYGFKIRLLSKPDNTTMDSVYQAIVDFNRLLKPNDQFIVYFAGHGDFEDKLLDDGFIVCSDSRSREEDPVRNSYIQHSKLKKMLNKVKARQVLVMLDICFGGTFDDQVLNNKVQDNDLFIKKMPEEKLAITSFNNNVVQFISDKSKLKTRKSLSSVGTEPAFDGSLGQHSPFANLLLQTLRARGTGSNGIVTLSNIYAVLQDASLNKNTVLKVSPHIASFGENDSYSEIILIPIANPIAEKR